MLPDSGYAAGGQTVNAMFEKPGRVDILVDTSLGSGRAKCAKANDGRSSWL